MDRLNSVVDAMQQLTTHKTAAQPLFTLLLVDTAPCFVEKLRSASPNSAVSGS